MYKRKKKIVILILLLLAMIGLAMPDFAMKSKDTFVSQPRITEVKEEFIFTPELCYEDIDAMVKVMEDVHVNLYHDISKEEFYKEIEDLKASITTPISVEAFRKKVSILVSRLKDGHTFVRESEMFNQKYYYNIGGLFPYDIAIIEDHFFVKGSHTSDPKVPLKAEILEINDVPTKTILSTLLQQQSGELDILKKAWLQEAFPFYYALAMGFSDDFRVKYIPYGENTPKSVLIDAVSYSGINNNLSMSFYKKPYDYEYLEDINAFYMKFDTFNDFDKFEYFLEDMFAEIKEEGSQDLIIDLRENTGGNFGLGKLLVSYLTDKPFRMIGSYTNKYSKSYIDNIAESYKRKGYEVVYTDDGMRIDCTKGQEHYYESVATYSGNDVSESMGLDVKNPFKGDVYVLIGNKTFSSGVMLAALLKDYKLATFIGEETGGVAGGYTCSSNFNMPNTNLAYSVSWQYFTRPSNVVCKRGVLPDIEIKEDLEHYFNDKDDVLEYAKEMIRNK